ncbi:hypothetical protein ACIQLK_13900 [Microbacterium sp. NPDC091382]|uniref:hypothetical protein n=1 Tax=Microbacterium sp. NPDC091382 TaxID=3364210 RepID=UPI00380019AD
MTLVLEVKLEEFSPFEPHCRAVWELARIENDEVLDEVSTKETVELLHFDDRELHVSMEGDERVIDEVFRETREYESEFAVWFLRSGPWEVDSRAVVHNLERMLDEVRHFVENPEDYGVGIDEG